MAIEAIIFDCFGVLAKNGWVPFRNEHFSHDPALLDKIKQVNRLADAGEITYDEFIAQLTTLTDMDEATARQLIDVSSPNEDLLEHIRDSLKPKYKLGLLSNTVIDLRKGVFEPWQIGLFDEVIQSYEVGAAKPDRRMYEIALDRLGVQPDEVVFVDDQLRYIEGAQAVGLKTILFENNAQAKRDLERFLESS